jgi:curved DNA-binding protein CbpA
VKEKAMEYDLLIKLMYQMSEPCKGTVYHYTSADGVAGIISNHEIWMSNTAFMNDTTELRMLQNAPSILTGDDFTNEHMKRAWRNMPGQSYLDTNYYYMASFSLAKDLLEQWRAYGSFCIGFDANKLPLGKGISLYRCLYTPRDIKRWILKKEKIKEWKEIDADMKHFLAFNMLYIASMKYKNGHFKNEKEVRLITTSSHNWFYNNSPEMYENDLPIHVRRHPQYGFPVPYVKLFIEQDGKNGESKVKEQEMDMKARKLKGESTKQRKLLPIKEVIIGPVAYQKEAKAACEILLAEKGYKSVKVSISSIPYRGLLI